MNAERPRLVSVLVPFRNEAGNVEPFCRELFGVLAGLSDAWEVFLVDDASIDGTFEALRHTVEKEGFPATVLRLGRHAGQTAALQAALDRCRGDVVVTLDGDLQNDPAEIPRFLAALGEGEWDFLVGWRRNRCDPFLRRALPSRLANILLRTLFGAPLHDVGCGLRAFRRECLLRTRLHGQMHRFLPLVAFWKGARVGEIPVAHRPRRWGRAKYGLSRILRIATDLAAARFAAGLSARPLAFFGGAGAVFFLLALVCAAAVAWMKCVGGMDMTGNPFFYMTVLLLFVSFQLFALGLAGEWAVMIYAETVADASYPPVETAPSPSAGKEKT